MAAFPFPYAEIEIDKTGALVDATQVEAVHALIDQGASDLLVISHGWNNDISDARALYRELAVSMTGILESNAPPSWGERHLAVVGILWPSMKFADADQIAGGAAGLGTGAGADDLKAQLRSLAAFIGTPEATAALAGAEEQLDSIETSAAAREKFVGLVRTSNAGTPPGEDTALDETTALVSNHPTAEELMQRLAAPLFLAGAPAPAPGQGGAADVVSAGPPPAAGGAADLGSVGHVFRAARNLLNFATYYQMKARAGTVGAGACADLLSGLRDHAPDVRLHLAGHSFGARVVSMAALRATPAPAISSVSLLQAAFSHYAFATDWKPGSDGFFRSALTEGRLDGPMLVTHTVDDLAVGVAYAVASRIAGQQAESVGGPDDIYGGLGRNGALHTSDTVDQDLLTADATYDLAAGRVHNLKADGIIKSHGDVRGPRVALAVLSAIASAT